MHNRMSTKSRLLPPPKQLGKLIRSGGKSSSKCNAVTSAKLCVNAHVVLPVSAQTTQSRSKSSSALQRPSDDLTTRLAQLSLQSSSRRNFSTSVTTIQDVVDYIKGGRAKSIVVMVGAGISTASGIPDFRSPGTGLYDNLKQYKIPYPEAIFDLEYFHTNPKPFFALAKELYPAEKYRPNFVHYFLKLIHEKDLLLRIYTQNIDGLERLAGIPSTKLVEAHGTFMSATCTKCKQPSPVELVKEAIFSDKIPRCQRPHCRGIVKPDIVFFGEDLSSQFYCSFKRDFPRADLLLILGTSLEVEPFAGIAGCVDAHVPRVLFNRELVGPFKRRRARPNDVAFTGDVVEKVGSFVEMLGWTSSLNQLIPVLYHHRDLPKAETKLSGDGICNPPIDSSKKVTEVNSAAQRIQEPTIRNQEHRKKHGTLDMTNIDTAETNATNLNGLGEISESRSEATTEHGSKNSTISTKSSETEKLTSKKESS